MKTRSMIILLAALMLLLSSCSSEMESTKELAKEVVAKPEISEEETIESVSAEVAETSDNENDAEKVSASCKAGGSTGNTKTEKPKKSISNAYSKSEQASKLVTSEPKSPKHPHTWTPVYTERKVQKIRQVPWTKCYACGADMTGNISHIDAHLENHESNVHYGTEYRDETYYETESYISGYRCSCGATK